MRRILPIACVAFAFTVGLNAQSTGTGSSQSTTSGQTSKSTKTQKSTTAKSSGRTVTLTGCLREGDTPGTYQLANVDMSGMSAKSGKGSHAHSGTATSGSSSTSAGSTSGSATSGSQAGMGSMGTVALVASGSVNLKEHVGHKVQVTGTWANAGSGTSGTSGYSAEDRAQSTSGQAGSQSNDMSGRQLTVKSLKHISDTCQ